MATQCIADPDDVRIGAYYSLKARTERGEPILIADSRRVLTNVLGTSVRILSVLCNEDSLLEIENLLKDRPGTSIYFASNEILKSIVGYSYHGGIMAELEHPGLAEITELGPKVVVLAGLDKGENVGAVLRNCAAFGIDSVILGPGCATAYQRNAIRSSRGHVFRLKIHVSADLADTIERLRDRGHRILATNQTPKSLPYDSFDPGDAWALLLGNEGHGLPPEIQSLADTAVTIPMSGAADSLNVAAASAVILSRWFRCQSLD